MRAPLPEVLIVHLAGLELVDFPAEPPWQRPRPSWGRGLDAHDIDRLVTWFAWFYGLPDPWKTPLGPHGPMDPNWSFTAVAQTIVIRVRDGKAIFDFRPSSVEQFSSLRAMAESFGGCKRQRMLVGVDRGKQGIHWIEIEGWVRPEFVCLAMTRFKTKNWGRGYWLGKRGPSEMCKQISVIPVDLDCRGGRHAEDRNGLRLAERSEASMVFGLSALPWGTELASLGGLYRYLKLREPISVEDDPVAARELLMAAQREIAEAAKEIGIRVDQAFTSGTSLCRVPLTVPMKYALRGDVRQLGYPDLQHDVLIDREVLEPLRSLVRSSSTRRDRRAHGARLRRQGGEVPAAVAEHLDVRLKDGTAGRIYVLRTCPACGRDGYVAHIGEWNWRLTCKPSGNTSNVASQGRLKCCQLG